MDYQPALLDALRTLRTRDAAQPFKARAYQTVITQLEQLGPIHSIDQLATVRGVGDKIRAKIEEVFQTGKLQAAEKARNTVSLLDTFQQIYGVGPKKAAELAPLFAQSEDPIQDLRDSVEVDPTLLNDKQKIGLKYYTDLLQRIPREEMDGHRDLLAQHFRGATLMGSYRRGLPSSGDIDVLLPDGIPLEATVKQMQLNGYILEVLALGPHKCMAICRLPGHPTARRLDLLLVPPQEMAYAKIYFAGPMQYNVAMRRYALTKGYSINEHGATPLALYPPAPPMKTEQDIFAWLGLQYIPPEQRVDGAQIIPI
jgi:DNA polymerase/3'-5' exonuclease PolX